MKQFIKHIIKFRHHTLGFRLRLILLIHVIDKPILRYVGLVKVFLFLIVVEVIIRKLVFFIVGQVIFVVFVFVIVFVFVVIIFVIILIISIVLIVKIVQCRLSHGFFGCYHVVSFV